MRKIKKIDQFICFSVGKKEFHEIAQNAFRYAVISNPFTINRMNIDWLGKRIENVCKGKLAEGLFKAFCSEAKIEIDFDSCETPFYQIDKRDFIWKGFEWDLKNNFLTSSNLELEHKILENLPCLIPNRKPGDQWDRRLKSYFTTTKGVAFLFSFMIGRLENGPLTSEIVKVRLNKDQKQFLNTLNNKFQGRSFKQLPIDEREFWRKWDEIDIPELHETFEIGFNSPIYFTAIANKADWPKFRNVSPSNFGDGIFKTRITNSFLPVKSLRTFSSILPF